MGILSRLRKASVCTYVCVYNNPGLTPAEALKCHCYTVSLCIIALCLTFVFLCVGVLVTNTQCSICYQWRQ
jgi:hypothetical protein